MRYENIEIGTSDFSTLIGGAKGNGISVEPVKPYFDRLPDREGWHKVNVAISNRRGQVKVYYVPPEKTTGLSLWVRGCNAIGAPHPTIEERYPGLLEQATVECIRMRDLFERYDVTEVGFLKIDTEGHDWIILYDYFKSGLPVPDKILYESNELNSHKKECRELLSEYYSDISETKYNTLCGK